MESRYYSIGLGALMLYTPVVFASEIIVTKTSDSLDGSCDSDCSLREAVVLANSLPGPQRIRLAAGTYYLTLPPERGDPDEDMEDVRLDEDDNLNGDLDIRGDLQIVGAGMDATTIDGTDNDRIMEVFADAKLDLRDLTLREGHSSFEGGALLNHGQARIQRVRFARNITYHPWGGGTRRGGAVANYGDLLITRSEFIGNHASGGDSTAGYGGGLHNSGRLVGRELLFVNNRATNKDDSAGQGGALHNLGTADIARSLFRNNYGDVGVVMNDANAHLQLANSTFAGNGTSWSGINGVLQNGGVYRPGTPTLVLVHVTVAGSNGFGLVNAGRAQVRNSIIGGNFHNDLEMISNCRNAGGAAVLQARGLLLGTDQGNCQADLPYVDSETFTRVLSPLANNGGFSETYALPADSPALDAAVGSCSSHDQRRIARPRDGDGDGVARCDLGAFER